MKTCVFCFAEFDDESEELAEDGSCPLCNAHTAFKPELETKLFRAQYAYRNAVTEAQKSKHLGEMYEFIRLYAWGKLCKKKRQIPMLADEIDDYTHDAAAKFIEHYLKDPEFEISQSFGGYLGFKIWDVLHNKKKKKFEEQTVLTNEAEVLGKTVFNSRVRIDMGSDTVASVVRLIREASTSCYFHRDRKDVFRLLTAFLSLLRSPNMYKSYMKTIDSELQVVIEKFCWGMIRNELIRNAE